MNANLRYWKSVVQAAEAELDAATTNSELKLAARRLLRARQYLKTLATKPRAAGYPSDSKMTHWRTTDSTPSSGEIGVRVPVARAER